VNSAIARPALPWAASALLSRLLLLVAVRLPLLLPLVGAATGIGAASALAAPWRRLHAAEARSAFSGS
jgi:hypothetical protein